MDTPARQYARLLVELHALIRDGKGNGEQADALREEMDAPWYAMTEQEQRCMSELSAALQYLQKTSS